MAKLSNMLHWLLSWTFTKCIRKYVIGSTSWMLLMRSIVCWLGRGRPEVIIEREQLLHFHQKGYTAKQMADQFGCSQHTGNVVFIKHYAFFSHSLWALEPTNWFFSISDAMYLYFMLRLLCLNQQWKLACTCNRAEKFENCVYFMR